MKVTQERIEDPVNVISGPASASYKLFDQTTLTRIVTTLGNVFPDIQPLKYNQFSLNEIIN